MPADLFGFWSGVPGHAHWHPEDEKVLHRAPRSFRLECLPNPFFGPLRTARVVLLFLSPGFRPADLEHARSPTGQAYYARQRCGDATLPTRAQYEPTWKWWTDRVKQLGITPDDALGRVAVLNIGAYKSESFHDPHMLAALPSSRACLGWAQTVLFPEAEACGRVVICLRGEVLGSQDEGADGLPVRARGHETGVMTDTPMRTEVRAEVARILSTPVPTPEAGNLVQVTGSS